MPEGNEHMESLEVSGNDHELAKLEQELEELYIVMGEIKDVDPEFVKQLPQELADEISTIYADERLVSNEDLYRTLSKVDALLEEYENAPQYSEVPMGEDMLKEMIHFSDMALKKPDLPWEDFPYKDGENFVKLRYSPRSGNITVEYSESYSITPEWEEFQDKHAKALIEAVNERGGSGSIMGRLNFIKDLTSMTTLGPDGETRNVDILSFDAKTILSYGEPKVEEVEFGELSEEDKKSLEDSNAGIVEEEEVDFEESEQVEEPIDGIKAKRVETPKATEPKVDDIKFGEVEEEEVKVEVEEAEPEVKTTAAPEKVAAKPKVSAETVRKNARANRENYKGDWTMKADGTESFVVKLKPGAETRFIRIQDLAEDPAKVGTATSSRYPGKTFTYDSTRDSYYAGSERLKIFNGDKVELQPGSFKEVSGLFSSEVKVDVPTAVDAGTQVDRFGRVGVRVAGKEYRFQEATADAEAGYVDADGQRLMLEGEMAVTVLGEDVIGQGAKETVKEVQKSPYHRAFEEIDKDILSLNDRFDAFLKTDRSDFAEIDAIHKGYSDVLNTVIKVTNEMNEKGESNLMLDGMSKGMIARIQGMVPLVQKQWDAAKVAVDKVDAEVAGVDKAKSRRFKLRKKRG